MVADALRGFLVVGLLVLLAHVLLVRVTRSDGFVDAACAPAVERPEPAASALPVLPAPPAPAPSPVAPGPGGGDLDLDSPDLDSFFKARIFDCAKAGSKAVVVDEPCRAGPATLGGPILLGEADGSGALNGGDFMDGIAPFSADGGGGMSAF